MVVAQTKRKGLPRVDITPTKRNAITIYHDQMGKSFRWIALNAPEFRDTSASHTSIARSYESTKEQLWEVLQEEWQSASFSEYTRTLYQSTPRRMDDLWKNNGLWTKY